MQPKKLKNGQLSFSAINLGLVQSEVIKLNCGYERSVSLFRRNNSYIVQAFRFTNHHTMCLLRYEFGIKERSKARTLFNQLVRQYKRLNKVKRS